MDTATLVDEQISEGRELIDELKKSGFNVTAAFWANTSEEGLWFLYIASDVVEDQRLAAAYRKLNGIFASCNNSWLSKPDIKLIGKTNQITLDVLAIQSRHSVPVVTRYRGPKLGSMFIEEAYIYPI